MVKGLNIHVDKFWFNYSETRSKSMQNQSQKFQIFDEFLPEEMKVDNLFWKEQVTAGF